MFLHPEQSGLCLKFSVGLLTNTAPPLAHFPTASKLPVIWICSAVTITANPQHRILMRRKCFQKNTINLLWNGYSRPLMRCHFNKHVCWTTEPFGKHYCSFACWHPSSVQTHMDPAELGFLCVPECVWVWQENRQLKAIDEESLIRTLWCCSIRCFSVIFIWMSSLKDKYSHLSLIQLIFKLNKCRCDAQNDWIWLEHLFSR